MKRHAQLEGELKRLSGEATTNLYRRLEIAAALLADATWLAGHEASLDEGEKYLADSYFAEYRGLVDFATLHAMFQKFAKATWEEHRFDIAAMEILYQESVPQTERTKTSRPRYKQDLETAQSDLSEAKASPATERRRVRELEDRVRELERENAELRGRIQELEKIAGRALLAV